MRLKHVSAIALAAALAALPAAPGFADQSRGMAVMSAVVDRDGNLKLGAGALSSERDRTGVYYVRFARPVVGCAYSANAGGPTTASINYGVAQVAPRDSTSGAEDEVLVAMTAYNGGEFDLVDAGFHLMVFCHR